MKLCTALTSTLTAMLAVGSLAPAAGIRGEKSAFGSEVTITVEGDYRVIRGNGIPDHEIGQYPGRGNPNTIAPQKYDFRVPANPKPADRTTPLRMQAFGVAVNGVVFDPGAAEWWQGQRNSAWQYEPMTMEPPALGVDASHAHVQPNGAYHYHGIPTALLHALTDDKEKLVLLGWAADGFPIYNALGHSDPKDAASPLKALSSSYRVKTGTRPDGPRGKYDGTFVADYEYAAGTGDLDECNGLFGATPEYPAGIYHYVLTDKFPFIPRQYRGTPDASFERRPPAGGMVGGPPGNGRGRPRDGQGRPGDGPFHMIPKFALDQMNLTAEQNDQLAALEQESGDKLQHILTAEQWKILLATRPPPQGQNGRNGGGRGDGPPQGGRRQGPLPGE